MEYFLDENGKWEDYGTYKILIEPSDEYIKQRELEEQIRIEEEENRPPSQAEIINSLGEELTKIKLQLMVGGM